MSKMLIYTKKADVACGQGARDAALEREAQLAAEKAQLKSGLGTALEQKALVESQLAAAHSEQHSLRSQVRPFPVIPTTL